MKIGILRIGKVPSDVLERLRKNLEVIFPRSECIVIADVLALPQEAFNKTRGQYHSDIILGLVKDYAHKNAVLKRILGVIDVDIYVPGLNFVFGEAESPGRAALISLWRLRPEFYGKSPNFEVFVERATKEAVHELGHTFGLGHCVDPYCVMYFSNSIFDTDRKKSLFCDKCYLKVHANTY
jgi:archaemetzincin